MKTIYSRLLFISVIVSILASSGVVFAAKKTIVKKTTYSPANQESYTREIPVKLKKKGVFMMPIKIKLKDDVDSGGVRIQLYNSKGKRIQNDYINLKDWEDGDVYESWLYNDDFIIPKGKYTYKIIDSTRDAYGDKDDLIKIEFSIISFDSVASSASVKKKATVKSGEWIKIGTLPSSQLPYLKKIKWTGKNIISSWDNDKNGKLWVKGYKTGTSTVTVELKNGKKYKCKVTTKPRDPNFFARLVDYNTRGNYFVVKFKNNGIENLRIYSSGAYSMHVDYKEYDRKLYIKGKSSILIKPKKSKTIKFKIKGRYTWPDYERHTIRYYFSYANGAKTLGSVWDEDSSYKKGSKGWYSTYWTSYEEKYEFWGYD